MDPRGVLKQLGTGPKCLLFVERPNKGRQPS